MLALRCEHRDSSIEEDPEGRPWTLGVLEMTRSRYFKIGCMFFFFFFYPSAHAIHPPFDPNFRLTANGFLKLQGKVRGKASMANMSK